VIDRLLVFDFDITCAHSAEPSLNQHALHDDGITAGRP
jgi:hypothetical protein